MENRLRKALSNYTETLNGCPAMKSTSSAVLDLFSCVGALRSREDVAITNIFERAYAEDATLATKLMFYARDIRGGLGERHVFRIMLKYAANTHPECVLPNIELIGVYGRYDDMYCLIDTYCEKAMWKAMKSQFERDINAMNNNEPVSLLAKWIKTPDSKSQTTRELGIKTALEMGYTNIYSYKRLLRKLRKCNNIVEHLMCANNWDKIEYSAVTSRAMLIYRNAFMQHDDTRFSNYLANVREGKEKINSSTLYPYDIIERYASPSMLLTPQNATDCCDAVLEEQWKALPNYCDNSNILVMADTSGSMHGRPLYTAVGLGIYFAERNTGAFADMLMTFSQSPEIVQIRRDSSLLNKIKTVQRMSWGLNTDFQKAYKLILDIAVANNVPPEEMPKALICISDMEFDKANGSYSFNVCDAIKKEFARHNYEMPKIVFWNVRCRHDMAHADKDNRNALLVSGQSVTAFKIVTDCINATPYEAMVTTLNSDRYAPITIM